MKNRPRRKHRSTTDRIIAEKNIAERSRLKQRVNWLVEDMLKRALYRNPMGKDCQRVVEMFIKSRLAYEEACGLLRSEIDKWHGRKIELVPEREARERLAESRLVGVDSSQVTPVKPQQSKEEYSPPPPPANSALPVEDEELRKKATFGGIFDQEFYNELVKLRDKDPIVKVTGKIVRSSVSLQEALGGHGKPLSDSGQHPIEGGGESSS